MITGGRTKAGMMVPFCVLLRMRTNKQESYPRLNVTLLMEIFLYLREFTFQEGKKGLDERKWASSFFFVPQCELENIFGEQHNMLDNTCFMEMDGAY